MAVGVPAVAQNGLPGVFVQVVTTFRQLVTFARCQVGLDHPDPVQFPTHVIRVHVMSEEQVFRFGGGLHLVGVVGDVHLLLAHQFPVEAVHAALKHTQLVERHHPGSRRSRCIAAGIRQFAYPALPGQVNVGLGQVAVDVGTAHDLLAGAQRWPDVEQAEQPIVTVKSLR
ncbi:hypothetical protein D3C86_1332910 [compost metagenome]